MIDIPQQRPDGRRGAYGLAVDGLEQEAPLLVPAWDDWPTVRIEVDGREAEAAPERLDEDFARYPDPPARAVEVDRVAAVARFLGAGPLSSDEIVHPRLGMIGALFAQWLPGRTAFHGGAFVSGGRAWAVLGGRGDGKSTVMAALALAGLPVMGDDTLVLDGMECLAGVRCVDLRPDAVARLGVGEAVATVRRGARARLPLDGAPPPVPLGGWIFLSWGVDVAVRELPPAERIARIGRAQGWHRRGVTEPAGLLDVAALPAWELARPRDWARLPDVVERVRDLAG